MGRWNWWMPTVPARLLRITPSLPHHESLPVAAILVHEELD
jgi:hypothetical protein